MTDLSPHKAAGREPVKTEPPKKDRFLVCGLGNLGQHCVYELAVFGVRVSAIETSVKAHWQIDGLDSLLENLYEGDCRQASLLEQIGIGQFRAALLVTSDDRVNIDTAMAIRLLSPTIRIVMRSGKENLNHLLAEQLGNFVAFEPSKLSAPAFTLAAMGDALLACFPLEQQIVQVVRRSSKNSPELAGRPLVSMETKSSAILAMETQDRLFGDFYDWDGDASVGKRDDVITLELSREAGAVVSPVPEPVPEPEPEPVPDQPPGKPKKLFKRLLWFTQKRGRSLFYWIFTDQVRRVAFLSSGTILLLLAVGTFFFHTFGPGLTPQDALYDAVVLLLGGYPDLLGSELHFTLPLPWWLRLVGLLLTLSGTVFMGLIYAVLTQYFLSTKFRFTKPRALPEQGHIILFGLGRVSHAIKDLLLSFGMPLVAVTPEDEAHKDIPCIILDERRAEKSLALANIGRAAGLVTLSRDELTNLEVGLLARRIRPDIRLILRTYDARFSSHLSRLWPQAQVLSESALAAEAFAAASFGEIIITLFRLGGKTVLVTEYRVEEGDTLNNKVMARFACGYKVVPLMIMKADSHTPVWLPFDDTVLEVGDSLYVLATIDGILRVENGALIPPEYELHVDIPRHAHAAFEGANALSRLTGAPIGQCREFMDDLPGVFPVPLYLHQGRRLLTLLKRNMVNARLVRKNP